jgi:uncharacterized protein YuzE
MYIDLLDEPGVDADEVAPGIVVDYNAEGRAVGIEIDPARSVTDPSRLETNMKVVPVKLESALDAGA